MKFFSGPATAIFKKMFWDVVKIRQEKGQTNDYDLVDYFLSLKDKFEAIGYKGKSCYMLHVFFNFFVIFNYIHVNFYG